MGNVHVYSAMPKKTLLLQIIGIAIVAGFAALNTKSRAAESRPGTIASDRSMNVHRRADLVSPPLRQRVRRVLRV